MPWHTPLPGLALELASPLLPGAFLLLACLGSICRAVTGVAGGATRMALTQASLLARCCQNILPQKLSCPELKRAAAFTARIALMSSSHC